MIRNPSYRFVVTGRVQGVYFRQWTRETALRLGIHGWVRNRDDGAVEGVACGSAPAIDEFRAFLQAGPPRARVDRLDWTVNGAGLVDEGFEIRR